LPRDRGVAEESFSLLDEQRRLRTGKPAGKRGTHGEGDIALEFLFCDTGCLEILPIEIGDPACA
jgi:hypothetical protein